MDKPDYTKLLADVLQKLLTGLTKDGNAIEGFIDAHKVLAEYGDHNFKTSFDECLQIRDLKKELSKKNREIEELRKRVEDLKQYEPWSLRKK